MAYNLPNSPLCFLPPTFSAIRYHYLCSINFLTDVHAELVSSGGTNTDYLWTSDSSVYAQYRLVEDWTATMQQQQATTVGWQFVNEDHRYSPG